MQQVLLLIKVGIVLDTANTLNSDGDLVRQILFHEQIDKLAADISNQIFRSF